MIRALSIALLMLAQPVAARTGARLLVVSKQSHTLAIVDPDTFKVEARIPVGEDPHEVVVSADRTTAFVSNFGEGTLHTIQRIDLVHRRPLGAADIAPLAGPHGLAATPGRLWFTAVGSKAIGTLDPATGKVLAVVGTGQDNTHMIWVSPDGKRMLASNAASGTLSIFDRTAHIPVAIAGAPPMPSAYAYADWHQTLVPTGPAAEGFAVSPDGREAWVGSDGKIVVIDLASAKPVMSIETNVPGANRLAFTIDGKRVVMTTHTGRDLLVFDAAARRLLRTVPIEQKGASGIQMAPDGHRVFVACPRDHYVAVVDLDTLALIGRIDAGREPDGLAWW